jgi:hypothetical protein
MDTLTLISTCDHCNGSGLPREGESGDVCISCNGSGIMTVRGGIDVTDLMDKLNFVYNHTDNIINKLNDIKDKCNEIWDKVK